MCRVAWADGDITISSSPTSTVGVSNTVSLITCSAATCNINVNDDETNLTQGDVLVQTTATGSITVSAPITWASTHRLTLSAQTDIVIQAAIAGSAGTITLRADAACQPQPGGAISAVASSLSATSIVALAHDPSDLSAATASPLSQSTLVDTIAELQAIGPTGSYALGCDLSGLAPGYIPVGTDAVPFTGTFDGLNHAIVNFGLSGASEAGVFGVLASPAVVRNLVLIRPTVTATGDKAGALAGSASNATISNIVALSATINGTSNTGGLVGYAYEAHIDSVYVTGTVVGTTSVGGVVGTNDGAPGLACLGGTGGVVTNLASKASVTGNDASNGVGGLVGSNIDCSQTQIGWSAGAVTNAGGTAGGGVGTLASGLSPGTTSSLVWDSQTSGVSGSLTTAQTHAAASFSGFNFTTIWSIRQGYGRPFLRAQQSVIDTVMSESTSGPSLATQPVTFTANIAGVVNYGTPQGILSWFDGGTDTTAPLLGTKTITGTPPQLTTSALTAGTHSVIVYFPGDAFFIENTTSVQQVVTKASSSTALAVDTGPIVATVTAVAPATGIPTGSVSFTVDGSVTPIVIPLDHGVAALDPSTLSSGTHTVSAAYGGDAAFNGSSAPAISVQVSGPTTSTLTVGTATSAYGDAVTMTVAVSSADGIPTGSARFVADGSTVLGEIQLTNGSASLSVPNLSAGTHTLTVQFVPDDTNFTASISAPVTHTVTQATSATNLQVVNIVDGVINLSASVTPVPSTLGIPTGSVVFVVDGADVATVDLANGVATFATAVLALGNHTVAARYSGDTNYLASSAAPQTVDVELTGFKIAATPTRGQVLVGGSASFTLILAPEATDFSEEVAFDCSDLPTDAFCTFSPTSTTIASNGTNVSLLITTETPVAAGPIAGVPLPPLGLIAALALLGAAAALLARARRFAVALGPVRCACLRCHEQRRAQAAAPRRHLARHIHDHHHRALGELHAYDDRRARRAVKLGRRITDHGSRIAAIGSRFYGER